MQMQNTVINRLARSISIGQFTVPAGEARTWNVSDSPPGLRNPGGHDIENYTIVYREDDNGVVVVDHPVIEAEKVAALDSAAADAEAELQAAQDASLHGLLALPLDDFKAALANKEVTTDALLSKLEDIELAKGGDKRSEYMDALAEEFFNREAENAK